MQTDAPAAPQTNAIRTGWLVNGLIGLAVLLTVVALLVTLSRYATGLHWSMELFTHWPVITALGTLLPLLMLVGLKRWRWTAFPLVVLLWNVAMILPLYLPAPKPPTGQPMLRAMSANVYSGNRDTDRLIALVRAQQPDVLVVMEINKRWQTAIEALSDIYPYRIFEPRFDNFGIGLLSKHPFTSQRVTLATESSMPMIFATIDFDGSPLHVVAVHALPPMNAAYTHARNAQLQALASEVATLQDNILVLGDLNTTSWSPCFKDFIHTSGLADSRIGFGIQTTWPVDAGWLRIPIDHALVSQGLLVNRRSVTNEIGSDHLPIMVEVGRKK